MGFNTVLLRHPFMRGGTAVAFVVGFLCSWTGGLLVLGWTMLREPSPEWLVLVGATLILLGMVIMLAALLLAPPPPPEPPLEYDTGAELALVLGLTLVTPPVLLGVSLVS